MPATATRLNHPYGVHTDAAGNIYIADKDNKRIRKVDATNGLITTVAGNGDVWALELGNYRMQRFSGDGTYIQTVGSEGTAEGELASAWGVAAVGLSLVVAAVAVRLVVRSRIGRKLVLEDRGVRDWKAAEGEAERAARRGDGYSAAIAAEAYYVMGEIKLRRGDQKILQRQFQLL